LKLAALQSIGQLLWEHTVLLSSESFQRKAAASIDRSYISKFSSRLSDGSGIQLLCTFAETKIGHLVYANGRSGGTAVTITLLFTFIMILLTFRLPTHLEETKSI
jgi:hypothetical protein